MQINEILGIQESRRGHFGQKSGSCDFHMSFISETMKASKCVTFETLDAQSARKKL